MHAIRLLCLSQLLYLLQGLPRPPSIEEQPHLETVYLTQLEHSEALLYSIRTQHACISEITRQATGTKTRILRLLAKAGPQLRGYFSLAAPSPHLHPHLRLVRYLVTYVLPLLAQTICRRGAPSRVRIRLMVSRKSAPARSGRCYPVMRAVIER